MRKNIWLELSIFPFFCVGLWSWVGGRWSERSLDWVLLIGVSLLWISPVSTWSHECSTILVLYRICAINLFHFSFICVQMLDFSLLSLFHKSSCQIGFLLPLIRAVFITIKSIISCILLCKDFSIRLIFLGSSENCTIPFFFSTSRDWFVRNSIFHF